MLLLEHLNLLGGLHCITFPLDSTAVERTGEISKKSTRKIRILTREEVSPTDPQQAISRTLALEGLLHLLLK